jgi:hypothetical protein
MLKPHVVGHGTFYDSGNKKLIGVESIFFEMKTKKIQFGLASKFAYPDNIGRFDAWSVSFPREG